MTQYETLGSIGFASAHLRESAVHRFAFQTVVTSLFYSCVNVEPARSSVEIAKRYLSQIKKNIITLPA